MTQLSLSTLELAQTTEQIYTEKIQLARSRMSRRLALQQVLAEKQAENLSSRYQLEANLEREHSQEITALFETESDPALPPTQQALANFRKATLLYFLSNRQEIIAEIRREFVVTRGHQKPTISQILDFILPKAMVQYSHFLSSGDKVILYSQVKDSVQIGTYLFHQAVIYPPESQRPVDLHVLRDMNAFYGQLIGVLSGLGEAEWTIAQQKENQLKEELKRYPTEKDNLPNFSELGPLSEDLPIFLIAQSMRLQIQAIINQKKPDDNNFESNLCQIFLAKYCPENGNPNAHKLLHQFQQLPSISESISRRIIGIFGNTKEKFLHHFEHKHPVFQPVEQVYSSLKLIAQLDQSDHQKHGSETPLYQELSRIFAEDLRQALHLIKMGSNLEAHIILERIVSTGNLIRAKLLNNN